MRATEDTYLHKGMRKKMVDSIREMGISEEAVLGAMMNVPRHFFLDSAFEKHAYEEKAFLIGEDQTISHPYTVAFQTQLLGIKPFDKILEVGTGSAYQACILAELKAKVFTIERQKKLFEGNKNFKLLTSSLLIKTFYGDGFEGLPTYAPFDKVLITAAAPFIPQKLIDQLKPGGIMVIPLNEGENQRMLRITKDINGDLIEERFSEFSFVPMLGGKKE
jgi:protein-L-isoaspartate(D-aspartate) O-methyltransferase